jgi:FADH2 O2-dependent halogenase
VTISAEFVIDASGPRGFFATTLGTGSAPMRWLPPTQGLYTHFDNVSRWEDVSPLDGTPPYPPDAAALHHVFPGGWIWVLGSTTASRARARRSPIHLAAPSMRHRRCSLGSLRHVSVGARAVSRGRPTRPFVHAPRVHFDAGKPRPWRCQSAAGGRSAAVDGLPLTLLGLARLLDLLETTIPGTARQARRWPIRTHHAGE